MLQVDDISFSFGDVPVLNSISFSVDEGICAAVIGESGCGKSTLLKLIYGIYEMSSGSISFNGKKLLGPKYQLIPGAPNVMYVAQDFDLMPYITVAENVGKFISNQDKIKKSQKICEVLDVVGLSGFGQTLAKNLSGGQQQRVAIARALAAGPELLLLDEPFNQIDAFRRNDLRRNLFAYFKKQRITCMIATHDSADILSFSDQVIVLAKGNVARNDTPARIYSNPGTYEIASLFGDVSKIPANFFSQGHHELFLYPHQLVIGNDGVAAVVERSYYTGAGYLVEARAKSIKMFVTHSSSINVGTKIMITRASDVQLYP